MTFKSRIADTFIARIRYAEIVIIRNIDTHKIAHKYQKD